MSSYCNLEAVYRRTGATCAADSAFTRCVLKMFNSSAYEENGEQKIIFKMMILVYNLRARRVGINQIKNVYISALNVNANDMFL